MKTIYSRASECKPFTLEFLEFRDTYHMAIKLKSNTSYMVFTTSSNSYSIPHTNMMKDSFKIEAKVMENSDPMLGERKIFTHEFLGF